MSSELFTEVVTPLRVGVDTKLRSLLLSLFVKRACVQYRFTAGPGNTPYLRKKYYHT
jgi:hypothetical protein